MTEGQFARETDLYNSPEIEKVRLLCFFYLERGGVEEFTATDAAAWLVGLGLARPNTSRLAKRLAASRSFLRGSAKGAYRLHPNDRSALQAQWPSVVNPGPELVSDGSVLPDDLLDGTRGFLEKLARQTNSAFEHAIYDGCAVLMRRLVEILLIMAFDHVGLSAAIKRPDGGFVGLEKIIDEAKKSSALGLSKDTKKCIDSFRSLGNFSAHRIEYNARFQDIENVRAQFRVTVEELAYKAGLR